MPAYFLTYGLFLSLLEISKREHILAQNKKKKKTLKHFQMPGQDNVIVGWERGATLIWVIGEDFQRKDT